MSRRSDWNVGVPHNPARCLGYERTARKGHVMSGTVNCLVVLGIYGAHGSRLLSIRLISKGGFDE